MINNYIQLDVPSKSFTFAIFFFLVGTITSHDINDSIKKSQETQVVKTDGTTEQLKVNRTLTTQEESILLPLIQGLIAAGEKSPTKDSKSSNSANAQNTTNVERQTKSN